MEWAWTFSRLEGDQKKGGELEENQGSFLKTGAKQAKEPPLTQGKCKRGVEKAALL